MKKSIYLLLALFLYGCPSPATKEGMIVTDYRAPKQTGDIIFVKESAGGSATDPFGVSKIPNDNFSEAVKASLLNSKAFLALSSNWGDEWALEIDIRNVEQPFFGFDFTVRTFIRYTLFLRSQKVYETEIYATGTATMDDSFLGLIRLRLANERSARANIKTFIQELSNQNLIN